LKQNPTERRERDYARGLHNVSVARFWQADLAGSLSAIEACVGARRRLAVLNPSAHEANLAHSIFLLAARSNESGEPRRALALLKESLEIRSRLAELYPLSFAAEALDCRRAISDRLVDLGRRDEALTIANASVDQAADLVERHPGQFEGEFTKCIITLFYRKMDCGLLREALSDLEGHLPRARQSAEADPARYDEVLGWYLQALALALSQTAQHGKLSPRSLNPFRFAKYWWHEMREDMAPIWRLAFV